MKIPRLGDFYWLGLCLTINPNISMIHVDFSGYRNLGRRNPEYNNPVR